MAAANDLLKDIGDVYARSLRANIRILENGVELARRASARDVDVAQLLKDGSAEMTKAWADYVHLSVDFAGRLIELGLTASDAVLARAAGGVRPTAPQPMPAAPPPSVVHLSLSGRPGTTCSAGFTVENNRTFPVTIRFGTAAFRKADGPGLPEASLTFEPPTLTLQPAEKTEAFVHVALPEDAQAGAYEADVALEGLPDVRLRLGLTVETGPEEKG